MLDRMFCLFQGINKLSRRWVGCPGYVVAGLSENKACPAKLRVWLSLASISTTFKSIFCQKIVSSRLLCHNGDPSDHQLRTNNLIQHFLVQIDHTGVAKMLFYSLEMLGRGSTKRKILETSKPSDAAYCISYFKVDRKLNSHDVLLDRN